MCLRKFQALQATQVGSVALMSCLTNFSQATSSDSKQWGTVSQYQVTSSSGVLSISIKYLITVVIKYLNSQVQPQVQSSCMKSQQKL